MIARWTTALRLGVRMLAFALFTVAFLALLELDVLVLRRPRTDAIDKWVPRWARILMRIFGICVEARGPHLDEGRVYPGHDERGVGRIFVANHGSGIDIPVVFTVAAAHAISRHDLASWPLIGGGARRIGTLFVDRTSRRSGATVLKQIAQAIASGEGIAMFPEGTSHAGDEVQPFRPGAFTTAERTGAQIIPLGIAYEHPGAYYEKEPFMEHMKRVAGLRRQRVAVEVGEPLDVEGLSSLEVGERARDRVEQLVNRARQRLRESASEPAASRVLAAS